MHNGDIVRMRSVKAEVTENGEWRAQLNYSALNKAKRGSFAGRLYYVFLLLGTDHGAGAEDQIDPIDCLISLGWTPPPAIVEERKKLAAKGG